MPDDKLQTDRGGVLFRRCARSTANERSPRPNADNRYPLGELTAIQLKDVQPGVGAIDEVGGGPVVDFDC
jgi:hypothetical protein